MTDRILVPFDGSPLSKRALEYTLERFRDASITAIYVIDPIDSIIAAEAGGIPSAQDWYDAAKKRATSVLGSAQDMAAADGIDLDVVTEVGQPAREILEQAHEYDVHQIVMGSHGRKGLDRAILGSVAERVTRRATVPVTIVR